jgi:PAS domain-containing protein
MDLTSNEWLRGALDAAPEGIVVCAARSGEQPVLYANPAFERSA